MAYAKLVKVCQDFALGKQSINTAITNLEAFYAAWAAEHGIGENTAGNHTHVSPYEGLGRHNGANVPRAMVSLLVTAAGPGGLKAFVTSAQPTVISITRLALGQWFIAMNPKLATFWGGAWPVQSSADIRFCKPVSFQPTTSSAMPGIIVSTYEHDGAAFALAEYSFDCAVYGY